MTKKQQKVQVYLDADVYESLQKIADNLQISFSKASAKMIEKGMNSHEQDQSNKKTHLMLTYLLGSVYDTKIVASNADLVRDLIVKIDTKLQIREGG